MEFLRIRRVITLSKLTVNLLSSTFLVKSLEIQRHLSNSKAHDRILFKEFTRTRLSSSIFRESWRPSTCERRQDDWEQSPWNQEYLNCIVNELSVHTLYWQAIFHRRTVKKYQCLLCAFNWHTEQILHYLSNRFTSKKKKDIYTLIHLLGKASYNRNNSRNNTDEHRWDIANPETNAALSKGQYITEGRVLTRNEFKRTNKSFVVQLSWIVNIPHGNPQSL